MSATNRPLFSVIVPVYNVEQYIDDCVKSVLGQSLQDFELILVDDGSTDSSGELCDRIAKEYASVTVVHQENQGLSAARNAGIAVAKGEYLVFLDGDDYLEDTALAVIRAGLEPNLDLLRYQAQEVFADGKVQKFTEVGFATCTGVEAFSKLARYHYTENAWLYAYRAEFFRQADFRYAEGKIAEDFGLTPLIIAQAERVKAIPDICYDYRQREGSIMHSSEKNERRVHDILPQLQDILPKIAKVPDSQAVAHYLVVSFLTEAARLSKTEFMRIYQQAKELGLMKYIHPGSLRAVPRAWLLRFAPGVFYRIYGSMV